MNYLLDTNVISHIMQKNESVINKMKEAILNGDDIFNNGISYYEIKRGLLAVNATTKLDKFKEFCGAYPLIFLDNIPVLDNASEIYSKLKSTGQPKGDADILIASMAKNNNMTLVTENVKDFEPIDDLRIANWNN